LRSYREQHPKGAVLDKTLPEHTVRIRRNRRRADRVIWTGLGRIPDPAVDVPSIVAEFVSGGRRNWERDYVVKRREYIQINVQEYWIIDRFNRIRTVAINTPDGPQDKIIREDQTYRTPLLPGFKLPLARLLGLADDWRRRSG